MKAQVSMVILSLAAALLACEPPPTSIPPGESSAVPPPRAEPPPPPPPGEPAPGTPADPGAADPGAADPGATPAPGGAGHKAALAPDGAACTSAADCQSGICEGQGCGPGQGICAPKNRACTRDLRTYCGCDGKTFRASGSCPGRRFASRGECRAEGGGGGATAGAGAVGSPCRSASDCQSGICEGQGCTDDKPGVCAPRNRACTMDLRPYCGCDGKIFRTSSSCPGRRYASRGECKQ